MYIIIIFATSKAYIMLSFIRQNQYGTIYIDGIEVQINYIDLYNTISVELNTKHFEKKPKQQLKNILHKLTRLRYNSNAKPLTQEEITVLITYKFIQL